MISLLIAIIINGASAIGYGYMLLAGLRRATGSSDIDCTFGDLGLLGFVFLGSLSIFLNFAVAISPILSGVVESLGFCLFIFYSVTHKLGRYTWLIGKAAAISVMSLAIARSYTSASTHFDTGLYHLQSIELLTSAPILLGDANLHMRFGYNSIWFPVSAMLSLPKILDVSRYSANPVLFVLLTAAMIERGVRVVLYQGYLGAGIACGLAAWMMLFLPSFLLSSLGTPNTDLPSNILVMYSMVLSISIINSSSNKDWIITVQDLVMLIIAAGLAVYIKLAVLPVLLFPACAAGFAIYKGLPSLRALVGASALIVLTGLLWALRGVATSGCVTYPSSMLCVAVPWRISSAVASNDMLWMRSWAREPGVTPDIVLADWKWLPKWVVSFEADAFFPDWTKAGYVGLSCVVAVLLLHVITRPGLKAVWDRRWQCCLVIGPCVCGLLFWFLTAPLVRYGTSWLLVLFVAAPSILLPDLKMPALRLPEILSLRLTALKVSVADGLSVGMGVIVLAAAGVLLLLSIPGMASFANFPNTPKVAVIPKTTNSGLTVNIPVVGQQCWDAPSPCTPDLDMSLKETWIGPWRAVERSDTE